MQIIISGRFLNVSSGSIINCACCSKFRTQKIISNSRFLIFPWVRVKNLASSVLSLAAVAGLQTVGVILVVAMLVTPGATAYLLTDRFDRMTLIAIASSILSFIKRKIAF